MPFHIEYIVVEKEVIIHTPTPSNASILEMWMQLAQVTFCRRLPNHNLKERTDVWFRPKYVEHSFDNAYC